MRSLAWSVAIRWIPWWLFAILVVLFSSATIALYRRDRRNVSSARGWVLTALRISLFLLASILLLDPAVHTEKRETNEPKILIVVDDSTSMLGRAASGEQNRIDAVKSAIRGRLKSWSQRFDMSFSTLSGTRTQPSIEETGETWLDILEANQNRTDLSNLDVTDAAAVIVFFSDGGHDSESEPASVAAALADRGQRLITVGTGPDTAAPDIALELLEAPPSCFLGDTVEIELTVRVTGVAVETIRGEILLDGEDLLTDFELDVQGKTGVSHWPISLAVPSAGRHRLDVSIDPPAEDRLPETNATSSWITVREAAARVLLLDSGPRWEFRYLQSAWARDDQVELDAHLPSPPPESRWPAEVSFDRASLFRYDVIVLGDLDEELSSDSSRATLRAFVQSRGGTLIFLAGRRQPSGWRDTTLEEILPIDLADRFVDVAQTGSNPGNAPITLTVDGEKEWSVRLLTGRASNAELWRQLPPPQWIYPASRARPGSTTFAEIELSNRRQVPVLVSRPSGAGRALYLGFDSTWRWRFHFGDRFPARFWRQVARWAVDTELGESDGRFRIGTDRVVYSDRDEVRIDVRSEKDESGDSWIDAILSVEGSSDSSQRIRLTPLPNSNGRYTGTVRAEDLARLAPEATSSSVFRVRVDTDDASYAEVSSPAFARFVVDFERSTDRPQIVCDRQLLESMAKLTGGGYVPLRQLDEIDPWLPRESERSVKQVEHAPLDDPTAVMIALILIIAIEWTLRKRWKLL